MRQTIPLAALGRLRSGVRSSAYKGDIVRQCEKDLGVKLTLETINAARITAAVQSGAGPDIYMTVNNWPQLYADSCADVGDVAEDLGFCVPLSTGGGLVTYRKSWLAETGSPNGFPANWDDFRTVGKKLKVAGHLIGQTAAHTFGDAPGWWHP